MNWLDIVIIAIILINVFSGVHQGFARMFFGLVALLGACWLALAYTPLAIRLIQPYLPDVPNIILATAVFVMIWLAVYYVFYALGNMISNALHISPLGFVDTFIGLGFGLLKGLAIVLLLLLPLLTIPGIKHAFAPIANDSLLVGWYQPAIYRTETLFRRNWPKMQNTFNFWEDDYNRDYRYKYHWDEGDR